MKIGVITFHCYYNYGAVLQCYGLQYILKKLGFEAELIDYHCMYIDKPYKLINLRRKGLGGYLYGVIGYICFFPRRKKFKQFENMMSYSPKVTRGELLAGRLNEYDSYIAGSDQIWNCKLTNFDETYFLDFVKEKKRLSYGASLGEYKLDSSAREMYRKLLSEFAAVTVRERDAAEELRDLLGMDIKVVLDPVLLLERDLWSDISITPNNKGDYIFVYQMGISKAVIDFARKLRKETGLRLEFVPFPLGRCVHAKCNITAGPREWVGLLNNAKYVITNSFHAVAFSVLFNKQFWVQVTGYHKNRRAENFLNMLGLQDRSIENAQKKLCYSDIDYYKINKIVAEMRERSIMLLADMLKR